MIWQHSAIKLIFIHNYKISRIDVKKTDFIMLIINAEFGFRSTAHVCVSACVCVRERGCKHMPNINKQQSRLAWLSEGKARAVQCYIWFTEIKTEARYEKQRAKLEGKKQQL